VVQKLHQVSGGTPWPGIDRERKMKIPSAFLILGLVVSASWGFVGARTVAAPASSAKDQLIGTWRLVSRVVKHADGTSNPDPAYGPEYPIGYIMYDRTGHMAVQFMGLHRPSNHSSLAYDAYFGTYSVNEKSVPPTVTHHLEGSLIPENVGEDIVRDLILDGDSLTLVVHGATPNVNINRFTRVE
jgi:Lipocalin-like domain